MIFAYQKCAKVADGAVKGAFFLKKIGTNEWDLHGALE